MSSSAKSKALIRWSYMDQNLQNNSDPNVQWVKIEWCNCSFKEHKTFTWLEQVKEPIGHLMEEIYPDSDSDSDLTGRAGTYTINMKLHTDIPQLLPKLGKKI